MSDIVLVRAKHALTLLTLLFSSAASYALETVQPVNGNAPFIATRKTTSACLAAEKEIKALAVREALAAQEHYKKLLAMPDAEIVKRGKDNAANRDPNKNPERAKLRDANSKLILDWIKTCTAPGKNDEEDLARSMQATCLFLETGYYIHLPMGGFTPATKASLAYSYKKYPQPANDPKALEGFSQQAQARLCK